jgi:hypothetical protein
MASSLEVPSPTSDVLTPNTRSEAEIALAYNAARQTASAAAPQATTPIDESGRPILPSRTSSNYADAATGANLSYEPPYPSEATAEQVRVNLSRGITAEVLERITSPTSPPPVESLLSKRASKEGERRTSQIAANSGRPRMQQRQSYSQQDLKRIMSEKLMEDGATAQPDATGYDSVR